MITGHADLFIMGQGGPPPRPRRQLADGSHFRTHAARLAQAYLTSWASTRSISLAPAPTGPVCLAGSHLELPPLCSSPLPPLRQPRSSQKALAEPAPIVAHVALPVHRHLLSPPLPMPPTTRACSTCGH